MSCPLTKTRRSRLWWCVLRGSEKETDGGERKGGGNGRGARFANNTMPVSKRKGRMGNGALSSEEGDDAEANHLPRLTRHDTRCSVSNRDNDLGITAKDKQGGLRIPTVNAGGSL